MERSKRDTVIKGVLNYLLHVIAVLIIMVEVERAGWVNVAE